MRNVYTNPASKPLMKHAILPGRYTKAQPWHNAVHCGSNYPMYGLNMQHCLSDQEPGTRIKMLLLKKKNKSNNKMTPEDILPYSQIRALLIQPSPEKLPPAEMETNPKRHSQTFHTERNLGTRSSKWKIFVKTLPSELRVPRGKGGRKRVRVGGDAGHQENEALNQLSKGHTNSD